MCMCMCVSACVRLCVCVCVCTRVLWCCARYMSTVQYVPFNLYSLLSVIGRKITPTIMPAKCAAGKQERNCVDDKSTCNDV